jgi:hypothetical protein
VTGEYTSEAAFDRLDHGACRARFDAVADVRQFDVHQVAEQALRMVGDADGDLAVAFDTRPLVGLHELQVAGISFIVLLRACVVGGGRVV